MNNRKILQLLPDTSKKSTAKKPLVKSRSVPVLVRAKNFLTGLYKDPFQIVPSEIMYGGELGQGTYGFVLQATYQNNFYAAKVCTEPCYYSSFTNEISIMKKITKAKCPNTVSLKGYAKLANPEGWVILMDLLDMSLTELLPARLSWTIKLRCMLEVITAVIGLHAKEIIHRDLKSDNILVTSDLHFKLCDFGLSKQLKKNSYVQIFGGTLPWIAPEVFLESKSSKKSDIWSLGLVLWEIVTDGKVPYQSIIEQEHAIVNGVQNKIPDTCPKRLADLMKRCWQRQPSDRPTAEAMLEVVNEEIKCSLDNGPKLGR